MVIHEGDVYWYDFGEPQGSEPGFRRPVVIVQGELFNQSTLATVVVCALTSTTSLARHPGNVVLDKGEAHLDRPSVAVATQLFTLDRVLLGAYSGTLSAHRLTAVRLGIRLVLGDDDAVDSLL